MSVPQHCEDVVQTEPDPEQPELVQTPEEPLQVSVPQHWLEDVQPPPSLRHDPPPQTPPEHVRVPQH